MAISLEALTAVAPEGSVGPLTLAAGAGALALPESSRTGDKQGRFVRRATNGIQPQ